MTRVQTVLRHGTKIFYALLALALAFTLTSNAAEANHQPADKVAASANINDIEFIEEGQTEELLSETFRTSTTTDLLVQVSSECSILTTVTTVGNEKEAARGQLRYFATISTDGGEPRVIGVQNTSEHTTSGSNADDGKVVFCDRKYEREVQNLGDSDSDDAEIRTFINTRSANAFNWIPLNVGNGIHTLTLYATYSDKDTTDGGSSEGVVGRRTMIIEPVKAKNDEQVTDVAVD